MSHRAAALFSSLLLILFFVSPAPAQNSFPASSSNYSQKKASHVLEVATKQPNTVEKLAGAAGGGARGGGGGFGGSGGGGRGSGGSSRGGRGGALGGGGVIPVYKNGGKPSSHGHNNGASKSVGFGNFNLVMILPPLILTLFWHFFY